MSIAPERLALSEPKAAEDQKKDQVQTRPAVAPAHFATRNPPVTLYEGDAIEILARLPDAGVDVVFADPPYFLSNNGVTCQSGRMVSVNKGKWDESNGVRADFEFNKNWLAECRRILKPNGTIWVSGTSHNIYAVGFAMQVLGYKILNDIAWYKVNPPPNLSCRYFTHSTETLLWAKPRQSAQHLFNYDEMKAAAGGKQMQSLWSIPPPRPWEKRYTKHPTQKPEALLERIVTSCTSAGDVVLDPFLGSGTTGVVAVRLGRAFIGIEREHGYLEIARKRIVDEIAPSGGAVEV